MLIFAHRDYACYSWFSKKIRTSQPATDGQRVNIVIRRLHTISRSINRQNLYSAPYKIWTAAISNNNNIINKIKMQSAKKNSVRTKVSKFTVFSTVAALVRSGENDIRWTNYRKSLFFQIRWWDKWTRQDMYFDMYIAMQRGPKISHCRFTNLWMRFILINLKRQSRTIMLSFGIKHSMRDLICDDNLYVRRKTAMNHFLCDDVSCIFRSPFRLRKL